MRRHRCRRRQSQSLQSYQSLKVALTAMTTNRLQSCHLHRMMITMKMGCRPPVHKRASRRPVRWPKIVPCHRDPSHRMEARHRRARPQQNRRRRRPRLGHDHHPELLEQNGPANDPSLRLLPRALLSNAKVTDLVRRVSPAPRAVQNSVLTILFATSVASRRQYRGSERRVCEH